MLDGDELAGVADQFGALTRAELGRAVDELVFRRGETAAETARERAVEAALDELRLVAIEQGDETLLAPGPAALPALPAGAEDLPHVLDAPTRSVEPAALADAAERRLRAGAARAVADGDPDRIAALLDATYELESWTPATTGVGDVRERLDAALAATED